MNLSIPLRREGKPSLGGLTILCLVFILGSSLYFSLSSAWQNSPEIVLAAGTTSAGTAFSYEVTTSDVEVDWSGGGNFDPWGKCPRDFFSKGFILLSKKFDNGAFLNFLYHKGKRLLYRIDEDLIGGKAKIGLHWVKSTRVNSKYRIADESFKNGKFVKIPNGKGGKDVAKFKYGQAVSKKRVQYHRELFKETHIDPDQCPEWWDIFNFMP